jgi:hypothetical protein
MRAGVSARAYTSRGVTRGRAARLIHRPYNRLAAPQIRFPRTGGIVFNFRGLWRGRPERSESLTRTFKERFHLDKSDPNILHDEITVFDHALTRPWSVDKTFRRDPNQRPNWPEMNCNEGNANIVIGKENYWLSGDGLLMPARKDQAPPDLRYFKQTQK